MEKKQTQQQNTWVIACPRCGRQYHLCEIALPGELLGRPRPNGIIKDPLGKIIYIDWEEEPVVEFEYCCDDCEKDFIVEASISVKAKVKSEAEDFSSLESSLL